MRHQPNVFDIPLAGISAVGASLEKPSALFPNGPVTIRRSGQNVPGRFLCPTAAEQLMSLIYNELRTLAAALQGLSSRTAKRNWAYARAWLGRELATNT
jgi:hypothetical protein